MDKFIFEMRGEGMRGFKTMLVSLALAVTFGAFGASWFGQGPKREVVTLVVTGNFKSPRLMAELIQSESRQPYLLLPIPGTPLEGRAVMEPVDVAKAFALVRLINPRKMIKFAAGRETVMKDFQGLLMLSGASGVITGGYLTTRGRVIADDQRFIEHLNRF